MGVVLPDPDLAAATWRTTEAHEPLALDGARWAVRFDLDVASVSRVGRNEIPEAVAARGARDLIPKRLKELHALALDARALRRVVHGEGSVLAAAGRLRAEATAAPGKWRLVRTRARTLSAGIGFPPVARA